MRKRLTFWISLLSVALILLAGCAPRAGGGETLAMAGDNDIAIDLPALVIDFDATGAASVGNVPLAQLDDLFAPGMLDSMTIPAETLSFLTESNIQHIQIDNVPTGLLILINGEPIPSLRWDGEILSATAETLEQFGMSVPLLEKMLPLLTHIGIGVIVRFPVADGVAAIPTHMDGDGPAAVASKEAQQKFLSNVGAPPKIVLPVIYSADGSWRIGDLTDTEWTNLTGVPIWSALRLQPPVIEGLMAAGISEASISTNPSGIHISINGRSLPYIGWADGELVHALDLAGQLGLWNTLADSGMNMGEIVTMIENLLPVVQASEADINVYFPQA